MSDNVDLLVGRFRHLPAANEEPAHPLASYYCDECGEPDWVDTHQGGEIREFYADDEQGDSICEPCARLRAANAPADLPGGEPGKVRRDVGLEQKVDNEQ